MCRMATTDGAAKDGPEHRCLQLCTEDAYCALGRLMEAYKTVENMGDDDTPLGRYKRDRYDTIIKWCGVKNALRGEGAVKATLEDEEDTNIILKKLGMPELPRGLLANMDQELFLNILAIETYRWKVARSTAGIESITFDNATKAKQGYHRLLALHSMDDGVIAKGILTRLDSWGCLEPLKKSLGETKEDLRNPEMASTPDNVKYPAVATTNIEQMLKRLHERVRADLRADPSCYGEIQIQDEEKKEKKKKRKKKRRKKKKKKKTGANIADID